MFKLPSYETFLELVITEGISGAERDYANPHNRNHPKMLEGSLKGFEACRGKSPIELKELFNRSLIDMEKARMESPKYYWKYRCFSAEVEWVCNCVSIALVIQNCPPIIPPTARASELVMKMLHSHQSALEDSNTEPSDRIIRL